MILVTGASGTVGRAVVERLAAARVPFRTGHSTEAKAGAARRSGLDAAVCDFGRPETIARALDGVDRMLLLAGARHDQTELEIEAVRVAGAAGVAHVVKISVWGAEEESFRFARIHRPVERALESSGIDWTFLRPNGFWQNLVTYHAAELRERGTIHLPAGDSAISHVDARDVADVAVVCLTRPGHAGRAYKLSGPEALTWSEIAERLSAALDRPVRYIDVTEDQARAGMLAAGLPAWHVEWLIDLSRYYRAGHAAAITDDVRRVLGRAPLSLDAFVAGSGLGVRSRGQAPRPDPQT